MVDNPQVLRLARHPGDTFAAHAGHIGDQFLGQDKVVVRKAIHRRYRITEGTDEIRKRRVEGYMFGFMKQRAPKGVS